MDDNNVDAGANSSNSPLLEKCTAPESVEQQLSTAET